MNASDTALVTHAPSRNSPWITSGSALVTVIAVLKFVVQMCVANRYGIFRDEMYYVACGQHLGWGYVDHPPLWPFVAWLLSHTIGTSLLALRLIPALCGAALVVVTGAIAREMGGGRMAQALAALAVLAAPVYLLMQHWFTMNAAEPLLWMAIAWCVLRFINSANPHWWLWIGILCGIGLEMKYSIVLFAAGLLLGLALTPHRRIFASKWFWIGCLAAILIFLPHFVWLARHHFPFLEYEHNVRSTPRDVRRGPLAFFLDQANLLNPVSVVLWIGGLIWLFRPSGAKYRILGVDVFGGLRRADGHPGQELLRFAGLPHAVRRRAGSLSSQDIRSAWLRGTYTALLAVSGIILAPLAIPVLPPADISAVRAHDAPLNSQSREPAHRPAAADLRR